MFWADEIAKKLKGKACHINDGKTPSGKIHVGSLRGIVIHEVIFRILLEKKTKARFSYIFDDFDPFDQVPAGLEKAKFAKYLGMPLSKIPPPNSLAENYGQFFANDFINVFTTLGIKPKILWESKLHEEGILDEAIKIALDNSGWIQEIYQKVSGSKKKEQGWLPFQPICQRCGRIGTTKATKWDGKEVEYECLSNLVSWAQGCGYKGKVNPLGGTGKLPWKVYWPAKWFALGITVEGEGKDLASKGGARDIANHIAREVYKIDLPYDISYEHFLSGGRKMSTSKGIGVSAAEMAEILPPELLRFLMLRPRPIQAINFDPTDPQRIPKLFDEYDKAVNAYLTKSDPVMARIFELSQVDQKIKRQNFARFKDVVNLLQISRKQEALGLREVKPRIPYAKIWLERFAPEEEKFMVKGELPEIVLHLSALQKIFLEKIADLLTQKWEPEELEKELYKKAQELSLPSQEAFSAVYLSLLGKDYGPKAAWLILSLDKDFIKKRFTKDLRGGHLIA